MLIVIAVLSLLGAAASLVVPGGVLLAPIGGLGRLEDRSVRQHDPPMNPKVWRDRS